MSNDLDDAVGRDVLASTPPALRLATIATILADGIRRQRDDARRRGDMPEVPERTGDGLELSESACPDRSTAVVGG
jgi:hypothetical protein